VRFSVFFGTNFLVRASLFASSKNSNLSVAVEVVHVALFLVRDSESLRLRCRRPVPRSATLGRGVLQRRLRIPTLDFQTESLCHSLPQSLPRSVSVDRVCLAERRTIELTARYVVYAQVHAHRLIWVDAPFSRAVSPATTNQR
jgi:hypothetical protein